MIMKSMCPIWNWLKVLRNQARKLLDGFVAATGYERKYAIELLISGENTSCQRSIRLCNSMTNKHDKL